MKSIFRKKHLETMGRVGFVAKGVVYLVMGALAALWVVGAGGRVTGGKGVIYEIGELPAGELLLLALAVGLAAYALLRLLQAVNGEAGKEGAMSIAKRGARLASAVAHGFLAFTCIEAVQLVSSSGSSKATLVGRVIAADGGRYLVLALGLAIVVSGGYQFYKAFSNKAEEDFRGQGMKASVKAWSVKLARFGFTARGLVFLIIGGFLVKVGLGASSSQTKSTGQALRLIARQDYGAVLLGVVALGLTAYGVYMLVSARYRRVEL